MALIGATNTIGPVLQEMLRRYGLSGLAGWASRQLREGASEDEIALSLYDQPLFKQVFPEVEARRKLIAQGGLNAQQLSVDDVLNYRLQGRQMMRAYGLPPSFYASNDGFYNLIVNDVSLDELGSRLDTAVTRVQRAAPEVRGVFGELFGAASDSALFALFVDVNKATPELERMVQRAEFGGAARRFGFELTPAEMARADGYGLTYDQAVEGFARLDVQRGLFGETILELEDIEAEDEGVAAAFGLEGGAAEKVARRAETRVTSTAGQAGSGSDERGPAGLGGAGRR
jgi:hypothetical protein